MARLPEASSVAPAPEPAAWGAGAHPPRGSGASVRRAALGSLLGMAALGAVLWQQPAQAGNVGWSVGVHAPGVVVQAQSPIPVVVSPHPVYSAHPVYALPPGRFTHYAYPAVTLHPAPGAFGYPLAGHRPAVVVVTDPWARPHRHGHWHGHRHHHHRDHHRGHGRGHGRDD